jgi:ankyrin repeat protein
MKTLFEVVQYSLGVNALNATKVTDFLNRLDTLSYGEEVSLKAHALYLRLLGHLEVGEGPSFLHSKQHIHQGLNKMFEIMYNNTPITSSPSDANDRALFFKKLSNGFQFLGEILEEAFSSGHLDKNQFYSCLDMIGDGGHACASRWRQVLEELSEGFSNSIDKRFGTLSKPKDPLDSKLEDLFYNAKIKFANQFSDRFVHHELSNISEGNRLHYSTFYKRFLNEALHLKLPIGMEEDPFLERELSHLKTLAVNFSKREKIGSALVSVFQSLFQEKIDSDADFRNLYINFAQRVFLQSDFKKKYADVSDFLANEIFEGFTHNVSNSSLMKILALKGFLKKEIKKFDLQDIVEPLLKAHQYKTIEKILKQIYEHEWEKEDVKAILNRKNPKGQPLIILAIQNSMVSFHDFLLEKGADPNLRSDSGSLPILYAAIKEEPHMLKQLIAHGANVNETNVHKNTALLLSCYMSFHENVKCLVQNNADVNLVNLYGYTPLMVSTLKQNNETVEYLLQNGADPNIKNKLGQTALMFSALKGDVESTKSLLKNGALVSIPDVYGNTALFLALSQNQGAVIPILQNALKLEKKQKQIDPEPVLHSKKRTQEPSSSKDPESPQKKKPLSLDMGF